MIFSYNACVKLDRKHKAAWNGIGNAAFNLEWDELALEA